MPLRNRIAQADSARDSIQLRQAQGRTAQLESDLRQQIENSVFALKTAHQAYTTSVESRNYQEQLLQARKDKIAVAESTNYSIVQDEAYVAQARSTEVVALSDWMKAQLALDRSLRSMLEKNEIHLGNAIEQQVKQVPHDTCFAIGNLRRLGSFAPCDISSFLHDFPLSLRSATFRCALLDRGLS